MATNTSNRPCPIHGCGAQRYPHTLLCWEHWCELPDTLRAQLEQVEPAQQGGSGHLVLAKRALDYYRKDSA